MATDTANGFQPASTLANRTFIGLLVSQFLAAFLDQAIHASAMFYAINSRTLSEASAISLMPILFYAPWALFCTIAGWFADRFSKRQSLVAWKFAELGITGLALLGFWLGNNAEEASFWQKAGPWIVLSTVFLMGTHSAFFVPAKYGAMPEILQPHLLSRGNGWLESLTFIAIILGTVSGGVMSYIFQRREENIGYTLFALAIIGTLASLFIQKMPAANPSAKFPRYVFGPLWTNIKTLIKIRPLRLALVGLAFFTFVVAYMRAAVYMLGESQNPRWTELKTSFVVGTVALGIGFGSPLAGYLSGRKVELGLIPLGIGGMVLCCIGAALAMHNLLWLVLCIVGIGFCTGFYLVPLYTLLQYRSPKKSKGNMVATNNLVSVVGATTATLLFFALVFVVQKVGIVPEEHGRDLYSGELVKLELERGKPVGFEVHVDGEGPVEQVGRFDPLPEADGKKSFGQKWDEFWGRVIYPRQQKMVIEAARDVAPRADADQGTGTRVTVSTWEVHGIEHFDIRRAEVEAEPHYDMQDLPKFLFVGAGVITLVTLLMLWYQLPDLLARVRWLFAGLYHKVKTEGVRHISGTAPIVLVTDATSADGQHFVTAAVDREVWFIDPQSSGTREIDRAEAWLREGRLIGLVMREGEATAELLARWAAVEGVEVLPVEYADYTVRFGPPMEGNVTPEEAGRVLRELAAGD